MTADAMEIAIETTIGKALIAMREAVRDMMFYRHIMLYGEQHYLVDGSKVEVGFSSIELFLIQHVEGTILQSQGADVDVKTTIIEMYSQYLAFDRDQDKYMKIVEMLEEGFYKMLEECARQFIEGDGNVATPEFH